MSLMGTLGKVAVGVMVAKGASSLMRGGGQGGLGGILGSLGGGQGGGGLSDILGNLGGQNQQDEDRQAGGLGGLLGQLGGGQGGGGGLADMIGGLAGGSGAAGGLGGILSQLGGGQQEGGSDLGDLFNNALQGNEPQQVSSQDEENARLLLRAMISAAKADGQLDDKEQQVITEQLAEASEEDIAFVREQLAAPVDLDRLVADVPSGMEQQVYFMSLLGITLDTPEEAQYLDQLAQGLNLSQDVANNIHNQAGVQPLYS